MKKILQIIPADNWWVKYKEGKTEFYSKLCCFALVEDGYRNIEIIGLDIDVHSNEAFEPNKDSNFEYILYSAEDCSKRNLLECRNPKTILD